MHKHIRVLVEWINVCALRERGKAHSYLSDHTLESHCHPHMALLNEYLKFLFPIQPSTVQLQELTLFVPNSFHKLGILDPQRSILSDNGVACQFGRAELITSTWAGSV